MMTHSIPEEIIKELDGELRWEADLPLTEEDVECMYEEVEYGSND